METSVRVGIIGVGNIGTAHANCVASGTIKGMTLGALCDCAEEKRDYCTEAYPNVPLYSDYRQMLQEAEIDAVIIAVPHPLHAQIAMDALRAGKHVQLEKPVDISVTKARALNEVAESTGKVFSIMFNQRTNELFAKAKKLVESGALGELKRSVWIVTNWYRTQHYYDSGTWRATWSGEGGGVLLNQAPHNLDLWQWICGMPSEVTAFCDVAKYHNITVEDDVTILTRYPNGATGVFVTSTGEYPGTNRLEISGDLGKLVLEQGVLKWWRLSQSERQFCREAKQSFGNIPYTYEEIRAEQRETAHAGILQNFANAILYGESLLAPGTDGIKELTISNAAYLSAWQGNCTIKLPLDNAAFDAKLAELAENSGVKTRKGARKGYSSYQDRWQINW